MLPQIAEIYYPAKKKMLRSRSKASMLAVLIEYKVALENVRRFPVGYSFEMFQQAKAQSIGALRRCMNYRLTGKIYGHDPILAIS